MSEQVETRLTLRERLTRGLAYLRWVRWTGPEALSNSGRTWVSPPVDRGRVSPPLLGRPIGPRGRAAAQETLAQELTAAQDVVANLPQ